MGHWDRVREGGEKIGGPTRAAPFRSLCTGPSPPLEGWPRERLSGHLGPHLWPDSFAQDWLQGSPPSPSYTHLILPCSLPDTLGVSVCIYFPLNTEARLQLSLQRLRKKYCVHVMFICGLPMQIQHIHTEKMQETLMPQVW